jgi:hypothetical protein
VGVTRVLSVRNRGHGGNGGGFGFGMIVLWLV